jgi:hypothetical protein
LIHQTLTRTEVFLPPEKERKKKKSRTRTSRQRKKETKKTKKPENTEAMQHKRIATESINATTAEKLTESREFINPTRLTNAQITEHTTGQIGENYEQISNCKQTIRERERD